MLHPAARHRPRVFVSYTHDSDEHKTRVAELCDRLIQHGVDCRYDQQEQAQSDWPLWMERQVKDADFVLMICTETYFTRLMQEEAPGRGLGAVWEGTLIRQHVYKGAREKCIAVLFDEADATYVPDWLPGTYYVIGREGDYERLYRHLTGDELEERRAAIDYSQLVPEHELVAPDEDEFFAVAFSPDGRRVAAGSEKVVFLWDLDSGDDPRPIGGHKKYIYSVAFSPDGKLLASGGEDGAVRVVEVAGRNKLVWAQAPPKRNAHDEAVYSVAFSPDGSRLASGGYDRVVKLWDASGRLQEDLHPRGRVTSVAFSPKRPLLAAGSLDDTVTVWNTRNLDEHAELDRHGSSVETVACSADGKWLASSGLDKTVRVWDLSAWPPTQKWARRYHEYLVRSVAFSRDGSTLASASWDKTVKIWDVDTGECIQTLGRDESEKGRHNDWIWSVAFSREGPIVLATGGSDGKIILWRVPEEAREQAASQPAAAA